MNQVAVIGCKELQKFTQQLISGFKFGNYYIESNLSTITVKNKYFETNLNFQVASSLEALKFQACIFLQKPTEDFKISDSESLQFVAALVKSGEDGCYDFNDNIFDYVLDFDELAELIMQTAWPYFSKLENSNLKKSVIKLDQEQNEAMDIDNLIQQIQNETIKFEVIKVQSYLKNQENDNMEDFANAFILIEGLQGMLKTCQDSDRKIAALVVANLIGGQFGDDEVEEN
ncbi:hypothetical protein SS50377_23251 [Spironucleus salmonicida]|uniref:Uncharacterized protein n=1 Tax=Spironucleus salmonicida TaxID=348837 RepID=V6LHP1_9EUKA|nr:hypothetical protein SS50377_23251 [Spironucleus salmonicida]|eukprot:EST44072.1 Hypothetical protein SS50377_16138 [Spironucleus salmonicida]